MVLAGLAMVGVVVLVSYQSKQARKSLCEAANENRAAIRDILTLAQQRPRRAGETNEDIAARAAFFEKALARVRPLDCERIVKGET